MGVRKFLDISTSHVTEETATWLNEDDGTFPTPIMIFEEGWFIWVPTAGSEEDLELEYGGDLARCFTLARKLYCDWILFDRDAEVRDDLSVYDW